MERSKVEEGEVGVEGVGDWERGNRMGRDME